MPILAQSTPATEADRPTLSLPRLLLHLEGAVIAVTAVVLYAHLRGSGLLFALLLFAPDLSFFAYLVNTVVGAAVYNVVHFYALPVILALVGLAVSAPVVLHAALIWMAHIGMDRTLGYGFKYPTAFQDTHFHRL